MQSNFNLESKSTSRKVRLSKPPRDTEQEAFKQDAKRGKQWQRENDKRTQWETFAQFD